MFAQILHLYKLGSDPLRVLNGQAPKRHDRYEKSNAKYKLKRFGKKNQSFKNALLFV